MTNPEPSEAAVDFVQRCRGPVDIGYGLLGAYRAPDLAREYDAALLEAEGRGLELVDLERQLQAGCNQTNPTKWAYEQVCTALHKHRKRADKAEAEVVELKKAAMAPAPRPPHLLDNDTYTDWLTGADGTHKQPYPRRRNRQCAIGYHDECTDPAGKGCGCPCHEQAAMEDDNA